jgi:hypothetical protein
MKGEAKVTLSQACFVCVIFCVKLGNSVIESLHILHKAFAEHSLSPSLVSQSHARFEACSVSVEVGQTLRVRSTSQTTENFERI